MIPAHPVATADAATLHWITPQPPLTADGAVGRAPAPLQRLLADGTLAALRVLPNGVLTTLGPAASWAQDGPRVRSAVHAALADPEGWVLAPDARRGDDAVRAAALDVLVREVAPYAAAHGGSIQLVDVRDGVVEVELRGACHGCPAAEMTLQHRLEEGLRRRCPGLIAVRPRG